MLPDEPEGEIGQGASRYDPGREGPVEGPAAETEDDEQHAADEDGRINGTTSATHQGEWARIGSTANAVRAREAQTSEAKRSGGWGSD